MKNDSTSKHYLSLIGNIAVEIGHLEMILVKSIGLLFTDFKDKDHFKRMNSILAGVHADKLSEMFLSLYKFTYPDNSTTFIEAINDKIHRLVIRRNRFLHSKWFFNDAEGSVFRIKFSMPAKKNPDKDSGDAKSLIQLIKDIEQVNSDVVKFTLELMNKSKLKKSDN